MAERPIVITGASGFLGSALVTAVQRRGWPVIGVTRTPDQRTSDQVMWIRWEDAPHALVGSRGVFHAATSYGRDQPQEAIREAIIDRPLQLASAAIEQGIPFLSADSFFRVLPQPYEHLKPYTRAKQDFRDRMQRLAQGPVPTPFLVIYHMIGPGDHPEKGLPALVRRIVADQGRISLTDGSQLRDFIHVDDVAEAFLAVLDGAPSLPGGVMDIPVGSGCLTSLRKALEIAQALAGSSVTLGFGDLPQRAGEPAPIVAETTWLRQHGWLPRRSLTDALQGMIHEVRHGRR